MTMTVDAAPAPDLDVMLAHLERQTARWHELDQPCWLEIRALGEGVQPQVAKFRPTDLHSAAAWARDMNNRQRNIYNVRGPIQDSAQGRAASDADIICQFAAFVDCDTKESAERLKALSAPQYTYAVITGKTPFVRVHGNWEFTEPVYDLAAWTDLQKRLIAHIGSDKSIHNPSRIMRLAGTISWPAEKKQQRGYVPEIASLGATHSPPRAPVSFEQMMRAFPAPQSAPQTAPDGFEIETGPSRPEGVDTAKARSAALSGEEWHNHMIRAVASYVGRGLSDDEIHVLTDQWTCEGYTVEQTRQEVQTAINGARAKGWTPEPYAQPDDIEWGEPEAPKEPRPSKLEWFDDIEPALGDSYVVKGVLADGAMSVVYGPSNSGKTFFAMDIAYHVAIGAPWRDHRVSGGSVLYLAAEGGRGVANRIAALKQEHGVVDVPLALRRAGLDLLKSQADLQHLADLAAEANARAPLRLLIIDTLSRVIAGGDENSAQDMTAFIRNIDALRAAVGCHIMIVHHTGKDSARGARGHSSLRAATDTEIEVQTEEGDRAAIVTKQRDYAGGEVFPFTLKGVELGHDADGDPVTSCIVEAETDLSKIDEKRALRGIGGNQKLILEAFDQLVSEGRARGNPGGVGLPDPGRFWCVETADLRDASLGKMPGEHSRSAFNKAFAALRDDRKIICSGENVTWRTDRRK